MLHLLFATTQLAVCIPQLIWSFVYSTRWASSVAYTTCSRLPSAWLRSIRAQCPVSVWQSAPAPCSPPFPSPPCSCLRALLSARGWSKCCSEAVIMHVVCHCWWFGCCFEATLVLALRLRQNCSVLHCSCNFTCFYVLLCFMVSLCQFGYNCMELCFWIHSVTFSYRSSAVQNNTCMNSRRWAWCCWVPH